MKKRNADARAKQLKKEKRAKAGTVVLMCFVALCLCGTVGVSVFTDIFKQESEVKAVALVLTGTEEDELERQLSKIYPFAGIGFDEGKMSAAELLQYIRPYAKDGLYISHGFDKAEPQTEADPAERFGDGEGNYLYYKIAARQIDDILSQFEIVADHTVNTKDIYYYDGNYYFADGDEGTEDISSIEADITESKRIQDGRYYITCTLGKKKVYVIASKTEQSTDNWQIHSVSAEPVFDQLGLMIKKENDSLFDYDMKTRVIEGRTDTDVLYCRYVIQYPVFYGETAGELEANRFYESVLTYYDQLAKDSTSQYKEYVKNGGLESLLPLEVNYSAEITYISGAYIAVSNEINETIQAHKPETSEDEISSAVVPSKKTVECYIFDTETGAYVNKDSIIGKDYQLIEELLYRIYCGYDYSALLNEGITEPQEIPEDIGELGKMLYGCTSTLTKDGYMFCYINESGYREDVTIPFTADVFEIPVR